MDPATIFVIVVVVFVAVLVVGSAIIAGVIAGERAFWRAPKLSRFEIDGQFLCPGCEFKLEYDFEELATATSVLCEVVSEEDADAPRGQGTVLSESRGPETLVVDTAGLGPSGEFRIRLFAGDKLMASTRITVLAANEPDTIEFVFVEGVRDGNSASISTMLVGSFFSGSAPKSTIGLCPKSVIIAITFEDQIAGALGVLRTIDEVSVLDRFGSVTVLGQNVELTKRIELDPPLLVVDGQTLRVRQTRAETEPPFVSGASLGFRLKIEVLCQD